MPNLGQQKKPDLSELKSKHAKQSPKEKAKAEKAKAAELEAEEDGDNDDDLDDEIIKASLASKKANGNIEKYRLWLIGAIVIVAVVIIFLLFGGGKKKQQQVEPEQQNVNEQTEPQQQNNVSEEVVPKQEDYGTQNFLTDTEWSSTSKLEDPEQFVKDLYGLTVRCDYEVKDIIYAADFVNYTKHRGTWGGGIELYYLDVVYKNTKYVVQVPFRYYKELSDEGIIPVKMEVLKVINPMDTSSSDYLTVVSYMCLDEETLQSILKSQNK